MKLLELAKWAMIPLAVLIYVANERVARPGSGVAPAVAADPVALDLGQKYRSAFDTAGVAHLDAAATSTAATTTDLARAQREALDAALKAASMPIVAELTRRFGPASASPGNADAVRAFYRDLAAGYRKGAK